MRALPVHGLAHITGGGLTDNIPRVLPAGLEVGARAAPLAAGPVFDWLQHTARIDDAEMYRTFNCGIGMVVIVPGERAQAAVEFLSARGESAQIIGEVRAGSRGVFIRNERRRPAAARDPDLRPRLEHDRDRARLPRRRASPHAWSS